MKSISPALRVLLWGLITVPPAVYLLCVYKFAVNIPYVDDYDAILEFMTAYKRAGIGQRLLCCFPNIVSIVFYRHGWFTIETSFDVEFHKNIN